MSDSPLPAGPTDPAPHQANTVITTRDLTKTFQTLTAVDHVSLDVTEGEIFGFLGLNGAGKTTLLKLLTGQMAPTSGSAKVLGVDPVADPIRVKERIGIVPEIESPPSFLTPTEFLHYVGLIRKLDDIEGRTDRWLDFFDLKEYATTMCKDLSKGTKQRVMLASAFIHEPALLFLDEPFLGLDPFHQKQVKEYLAKYLDGGGTVFLCTHILELAEKLCTRIAIIDRGCIVSLGTLSDMLEEGEGLDGAFLRLTGKSVENDDINSDKE